MPAVQPKDSGGFNFSSQLDSKSVKHTALSLLSVVLKRALKTVDYCLSGEVWQEPGVYTAPMMEDFVRLFREALSKVGAEARRGLPGEASRALHTASQSAHWLEEAVSGRTGPAKRRASGRGPESRQELLCPPRPTLHAHWTGRTWGGPLGSPSFP